LALAACTPAESGDTGMNAGSRPEPAAAAAGASSDPFLFTWPAPVGGPSQAMGAEGMLELDGRCFYLRMGDGRLLLVFPEGTTWDASANAVQMGKQPLKVGSRLAFSGQSRSGAAAVAPGFDARGCDAARVFRVVPWLVR
jgi:hypothetical protein